MPANKTRESAVPEGKVEDHWRKAEGFRSTTASVEHKSAVNITMSPTCM